MANVETRLSIPEIAEIMDLALNESTLSKTWLDVLAQAQTMEPSQLKDGVTSSQLKDSIRYYLDNILVENDTPANEFFSKNSNS